MNQLTRVTRRALGLPALGLLALLAGPVAVSAATPPATPHAHALHGTVKSLNVGAKSLVVTVTHGDSASTDVTVNAAGARVHVPGARGRNHPLGTGVLGDLLVGDHVVAHGHYADATHFTATRLHLVPGGRHLHVTGTAGVSGSTITVTKDGTATAFTTNADTKIRPEGKTLADANGKKVTVVGRRTPSGNVATGIVIHAS